MKPDPRRKLPADAVSPEHGAGVVIPVRAFRSGKLRLKDVLSDKNREEFVRQMANRVADAAGDLPTAVVSDAPEVRDWARERGVEILDDPGTLDSAAMAGALWCEHRGLSRLIFAHGDLPLASPGSLASIGSNISGQEALIVPCHREDGTNVLALPVAAILDHTSTHPAFRFAFGPGSFKRHEASALEAGLAVQIIRDPGLCFDVDLPSDLAALSAAEL